jgi:GTPase
MPNFHNILDPETLPTIVLIGRTNVGKSSLFNRLTETKQAFVSPIPGTTRDINRGIVEWEGYYFTVIDTGGIDLSKPDDIDQSVIKRAWELMEKADKVFLLTDSKAGLLPGDATIAQQMREKAMEFEIIANKSDSPKLYDVSNEFFQIHEKVHPLSAANGSGTGDFLDYLVQELHLERLDEEAFKPQEEDKKTLSIAFAGVPNVGKSSLMNALLGRDEVIVSPQAHTTRESRDSFLQYKDREVRLVDTAGIRKPRKMRKWMMRKSAEFSIDAIHDADWVIFVIDSTVPKWGEQERYILNEIVKSGKNVIFAANKWDLLKEDEERFESFKDRFWRTFGSYAWIPVIPISAQSGWHVNKLLDKILELDENRYREFPQSALDRLLKQAIKRRRPQKKKGPEAPFVHTIKQIASAPPTFEIVIQYQDTLAESYVRFLAKMFREKFDFEGTPVRIYVRSVQQT